MRIRWTVPAARDSEDIKSCLEEHCPHFAEPTVRAIYQPYSLSENGTQPTRLS
jgi:hypothetical protein